MYRVSPRGDVKADCGQLLEVDLEPRSTGRIGPEIVPDSAGAYLVTGSSERRVEGSRGWALVHSGYPLRVPVGEHVAD